MGPSETTTTPTIFVAWDSRLDGFRTTLERLKKEPGAPVLIRELGAVDPAFGFLSERVRAEVEGCDALLALVETPNANMCWELGLALGHGKRVALMSEGSNRPPWLAHPPLQDLLHEGSGAEPAAIRAVIAHHEGWPSLPQEPRVAPGGLILCPSTGYGAALLEALQDDWLTHHADWRLLAAEGWAAADLPEQIAGIDRATWVIPARAREEEVHGDRTAQLAVVAAFLHARGIPLLVLVHSSIEIPADLQRWARRFGGEAELLEKLRVWNEALEAARIGGGGVEPDPAADLLDRYRRQVAASHSNLLPLVDGDSEHVLQEVHVDLRVEARGGASDWPSVIHEVVEGVKQGLFGAWFASAGSTPQQERLEGLNTPTPIIGRWGIGKSALAGSLFADRSLRGLLRADQTLSEARGHAPRWVLLGAPGSGKTTSVRHLAHTLATNPSGPLPLFLPLSRLADDGLDLFRAADLAFCKRDRTVVPGTLEAALRAHLQAGEALWVILDGLDEVDPDRQADVTSAILDFADAHPSVLVLVTSRPVVAAQKRLPGAPFLQAEVRPLERPQQEELVRRLVKDEAQATRVWSAIQDSGSLCDLCGNPLMLTLAVQTGRVALKRGRSLPVDRLGLFKASVDLLLRRGFRMERADLGMQDPKLARQVLVPLSLRLHADGGERWDEDALWDAMWRLVDDGEPRPGQRLDASTFRRVKRTWPGKGDGAVLEAFRRDLLDNGGVIGFHDGQDEPCRYLHRALREYLAAEALRGLSEEDRRAVVGVGRLDDAGEPVRFDEDELSRWGEVLSLLCSMLGAEAVLWLRALAQVAPDVAVRALRSVEGIGAAEHLGLLAEAWGGRRSWTGEDLDAVVACVRRNHGKAAEAELRAVVQERALEGEGDGPTAAPAIPRRGGRPAQGQEGPTLEERVAIVSTYALSRWGVPTAEGEAVVAGLASLDPALGMHGLCLVDGIPPARRLSLSLTTSSPLANEEADRVIDRCRTEGGSAAIWEGITPNAEATFLGLAWYALEQLGDGPPDRARFFAACGRALPTEGWVAERLPTVQVQAGSYWMGSPEGVGDDDEWPRHQVTLSQPFGLGKTTVTVAAWRAFDPDHRCPGGEEHPVTHVDWFTARLFCAWAGGSLPTEAAWEYACRAGTDTAWSFGDDEAELDRHGWFAGNSQRGAHPVGQKAPNPWGLLDMHGNVWEWCEDRRGSYEPGDVVDPTGPPTGVGRVLRGGGFWFVAVLCRSAIRLAVHPGFRLGFIGFRVCFAPRALGSRT